MKHVDIYQTVTDTIIEAIENGIEGKCEMPWHGVSSLPYNALTKNSYRGVNIPQLWACKLVRGFSSGVWATYRQWAELGAQVKKGSKGVQVVFYKQYKQEDENDDENSNIRMFARYSTVFNADQVEGYEPPAPDNNDIEPAEIKPVEMADNLINATGADIRHNEDSAYYEMVSDYINLPPCEKFKDTKDGTATDNYYNVAFHELTHWTGAKHRLDRVNLSRFGSPGYAFEELVAELGSAMCCAITGIESAVREDHSKYIKNWLKALKDDKKFIFTASSHAQKAVDYLYSFQEQQKEVA